MRSTPVSTASTSKQNTNRSSVVPEESQRMSENVLPFPKRAAPRRQPIGPSAVIGTFIFVVTELMLFAGFMSAFTITRAAYNTWPPIGQPRLPASETLINSTALMASGVVLYFANRAFVRGASEVARIASVASAQRLLLIALLLGLFFVGFQGMEWAALLREGLTMTSSNHGAFFYLIVGTHALHALAAIVALGIVYFQMLRGRLAHSTFLATQVFWYFVVGVWPMVYLRVYL
jgi:cytochrome c oxidase subunit 3